MKKSLYIINYSDDNGGNVDWFVDKSILKYAQKLEKADQYLKKEMEDTYFKIHNVYEISRNILGEIFESYNKKGENVR